MQRTIASKAQASAAVMSMPGMASEKNSGHFWNASVDQPPHVSDPAPVHWIETTVTGIVGHRMVPDTSTTLHMKAKIKIVLK
jgi:hypothetical protein